MFAKFSYEMCQSTLASFPSCTCHRTKYPVMPIEFFGLFDAVYPTALYNCRRQFIVMVVLQLASTVTSDTPPADICSVALERESTPGVLGLASLTSSMEKIVDLSGLNLPNIVVG